MNDYYAQTVKDLDAAIIAAETAYNNAMDPEDETDIDDALEILRCVRARVRGKV